MADADGKITIDVEANTSKFDRQIMDLEKKIENEEKNKIEIETKIQEQETSFQEAIKQTDKYAEVLEKVQRLKKEIASQKATPEQFTELQGYTRDYGTEEQITQSFDKALDKQIKIEQQLQKTKNDYDAINGKVDEYAQKIEQINMQKQVAEIEEAKKSFNGVIGGIQKSIKNIGRLALSIIGIRSLLLGVRQAVSLLSQYDEDLANKIEAIKLALASALAPIVEFIVNLLVKAVSLLGYVLKLLFGVDIFAKSSAMSLKKATGSAKELKKQLAGFDEITMLNEDGSTGIGGIGNLANTLQDMNEMGKGLFEDFFSIEKGKQKMQEFIQDLKTTFGPVAQWIYDNVWIPMKRDFGIVMKTLEPLLKPLKEAWEKTLNDLKPLWDLFVAYVKPNVIDPILEKFRPIGKEIYNFLVPYANAIIDMINSIFGVFGVKLEHWEYITDEALNNTGENAEETANDIEQDLGGALEFAMQKAIELDRQDVDVDVNTTQIDNAENGLQNILDDLWELVKKPWNIVTKIVAQGSNSLNNFLQPLRNTLSNIGIKLPFLASGGIVNMPNKGTLIGSARAGESGREGVIPLTDQQAMSELGREIGKNITVNANIINSMNGRIISRELKQVQSEQDFAYNT